MLENAPEKTGRVRHAKAAPSYTRDELNNLLDDLIKHGHGQATFTVHYGEIKQALISKTHRK